MAVRALHDGAFDFLAKPFAADHLVGVVRRALAHRALILDNRRLTAAAAAIDSPLIGESPRSEEHTSELQSLMRISYAVFCLKNKKHDHIGEENMCTANIIGNK